MTPASIDALNWWKDKSQLEKTDLQVIYFPTAFLKDLSVENILFMYRCEREIENRKVGSYKSKRHLRRLFQWSFAIGISLILSGWHFYTVRQYTFPNWAVIAWYYADSVIMRAAELVMFIGIYSHLAKPKKK